VRRWVAGLVLLVLVAWVAALVRQRQGLGLENHLQGHLPLPFVPLGRPAVHPDGRLFLVTAAGQLIALAESGQLLWNKRLLGPVTPQPVLCTSSHLVLQGDGRLHGFSLGGEPRFSVENGAGVGDLPAADSQGRVHVLARDGAAVGVAADARPLYRTALQLTRDRRLLLLPGDRLLCAGSGPAGSELVLLAEGQVLARRPLPAAPAGLALSAGQEVVVSAGREVLRLSPALVPLERVALPGAALGAALALADGSIAVLVRGAAGVELCRIAPGRRACVTAGAEPDLPTGPVLGWDGRVYAPFSARGGPLLPDYHGLVAVGPDGAWFRQRLPGPVLGLTLSWSGGVLCLVEGERYLWQLEGGGRGRVLYHPYPLPGGNPAGSLRAWPAEP
jgi:hypothetical protein